jgi:integrase
MSAPEYVLQFVRDKWHVVWWRAGKRIRLSTFTADKSEAERRAPKIFLDNQPPVGTSVGELWAAYVASRTSPVTVQTMDWKWPALRDRFGPMLVEDISDAVIAAHTKARRAAGIQDGTIRSELGRLRIVLNWAKKQKLIAEVPKIELPKMPASTVPHLTREEVTKLINAAEGHLKLYVIVAVTTGARDEAIRDLTWDRVDFSANVIRLKDPAVTYNQKGRPDVAMNSMVLTALVAEAQKIMQTGDKLQGPVIRYHNHRVGSVKKSLAAAGRRAGILHHVHPHMLRHTAAVHMLQAGKSLLEVSQVLGHKNVKITQEIYGRFAPHELSQAVSSLVYDVPGSPVHL